MNLKTLLSILLVYRSNFHVLHWNATGPRFDTMHKIAADYYDMLLEDADVIAEMSMRLEQGVVNYPEAYEALKDIEYKFTVLPSNETYEFEPFALATAALLKDIKIAIEEVLKMEELKDPSNVGIKAELEGLHNKYDLEFRYLNARRLGKKK